MEEGKCSQCGGALLWIRTDLGNLIALDEEPSPSGDVAIVDSVAHVQRGDLFEEMMPGPRYRQHAATCSKKKGKK